MHTYGIFNCTDNRQKIFFNAVSPSGCVCPGDTLSFECTVGERLAITIWLGSAFDCSNSANEITLLHWNVGCYSVCNNGAITARILSVEGNNYTSQLNVTVTPDMAGKTVTCASDTGADITFYFTSVIALTGLSPFIAI